MDAVLPFQVGDLIADKYRVERVLGQGGMGVVVAARHIHLGERVAIKVLQPEAAAHRDVVTRFMREGQAAAKLRGEHLARVYDVGTLPSGALYLVMEYLEGYDLLALVQREGPLSVSTAADYVMQACVALAEAHANGIVHRDIKPANLFVTAKPDGTPLVKVIDFGISKVGRGSGTGIDLTKTTEVRGSLAFMPPEQMASMKNTEPRSDIWALGVTLYFLLSEQLPFPATTVPELCHRVLKTAPVPLREHWPNVSPELEAIVLRCLEKEVDDRFGNVAELAAALVPFAEENARIYAEAAARILRVSFFLPAPEAVLLVRKSARGTDFIKMEEAPVSEGSMPTLERTPPLLSAHTGHGSWSRTGASENKALLGGIAVMLASLIGLGLYFLFELWGGHVDAEGQTEKAPVTNAALSAMASSATMPVASEATSATIKAADPQVPAQTGTPAESPTASASAPTSNWNLPAPPQTTKPPTPAPTLRVSTAPPAPPAPTPPRKPANTQDEDLFKDPN